MKRSATDSKDAESDFCLKLSPKRPLNTCTGYVIPYALIHALICTRWIYYLPHRLHVAHGWSIVASTLPSWCSL